MDTNVDRKTLVANPAIPKMTDGVMKASDTKKSVTEKPESNYSLAKLEKTTDSSFMSRLSCWWSTNDLGGIGYVLDSKNGVELKDNYNFMLCEEREVVIENALAIANNPSASSGDLLHTANTLLDMGAKQAAGELYLRALEKGDLNALKKLLDLEADGIVNADIIKKTCFMLVVKPERTDSGRVWIAKTLFKLGAKESAVHICLAVNEDNVKDYRGSYSGLAADALLDMGATKEAKEIYTRIAIGSYSPMKGIRGLVKMGDKKLAAKILREYLKPSPTNSRKMEIAKQFAEMGMKASAREICEPLAREKYTHLLERIKELPGGDGDMKEAEKIQKDARALLLELIMIR